MKTVHFKKGLTLIEIIISMAILSIIFISFSGVFTSGFSYIMAMGQRTKAVEDAQKAIDVIEQQSKILPHPITSTDINNVIINSIDNTGRITLSDLNNSYVPVASTPDITMCKITIRVTYDNGTKSVYLTSLLP